MSDRFLAITLALCLVLPLCLSLDGDLFGRNVEKTAHRQVEELLGANLIIETAAETDQLTERAGEEDGTPQREVPVRMQGPLPPQAAALSGANVQSDRLPAPSTAAGSTTQR